MPADTVPARLFRRAAETPDRPATYTRVDGEYRPTTWSGYADEVRRAAKALIAAGMEPGGHAAMIGFNRAEWVVLDLACMAAGGAPVGIYTTSSSEEIEYVVSHAGVETLLVADLDLLDRVLARREGMPTLRTIVAARGMPHHPEAVPWERFLASGDHLPDRVVEERVAALGTGDPGTLIYTSGTTGPPKGVTLTHHNLAWTSDRAGDLVSLSPEDRLISYLPLSHIAEQMFTIHGAITHGFSIWFAVSAETFPEDLREVRPTIFFGVPRVWEKMQGAIAARLAEATGLKARLAAAARRVGLRHTRAVVEGNRVGPWLAARYALFDRLVYRRIREAIGLDACRFAISGAAKIPLATLEFFAGLGIPIYEVYGLSETSGPSTFNGVGRGRLGSAGPPFPGVEVRLADDDEILVRGGNVFAGYHHDPEATAAVFEDDWFRTGDLGRWDEDGYLHITGRRKEIIVTAGGKNIAPVNLESALEGSPLVSGAVLVGEGRPYLTALITLDPTVAGALAAEQGATGPLHEAPVVREAIQALVDQVNATVARAAQIKAFAVLPRELSIDEGELTGTLKARREVVLDHFADTVAALYPG